MEKNYIVNPNLKPDLDSKEECIKNYSVFNSKITEFCEDVKWLSNYNILFDNLFLEAEQHQEPFVINCFESGFFVVKLRIRDDLVSLDGMNAIPDQLRKILVEENFTDSAYEISCELDTFNYAINNHPSDYTQTLIQKGTENLKDYETTINLTWAFFQKHVGEEIMNKICQLKVIIDNAPSNAKAGYTPIITPYWSNIFVIKLNIKEKYDAKIVGTVEEVIVYQLAHELAHLMFHACFGEGKPKATKNYAYEETLCTAIALMAVREIWKQEAYKRKETHLLTRKNEIEPYYRRGVVLARNANFSFDNLKEDIQLVLNGYGHKKDNVYGYLREVEQKVCNAENQLEGLMIES
ncbi:MAG: hypothetical protein R3Y63_10205 [Eubacteriales bacterium]